MERLLFVSGLYTFNGRKLICFNRVFPYREISTVADIKELEEYLRSIIEGNPAVILQNFRRLELPE
jgi:hypothetical protein